MTLSNWHYTRLLATILAAAFVGCTIRTAAAQENATAAPASASFAYGPAPGDCEVASVEALVLHDKARGKYLAVKVYYPKKGGPFPVIIFSHGAGGSKNGYQYLGEHWASRGYVCIHPTHADSVALMVMSGVKVDGMGQVVQDALTDSKAWVARPRDVAFVIDSIDEIERKTPGLKNRIDRKHIGAGGHSFGAYTSQVIGGATIDLPGGPTGVSLADGRVSAVLLLSGQGVGQMGLHQHSWDNCKLPMMSVTGTNDFGAKRQGPEWRADAFKYSPPGDKYYLFIRDANHFTFSGGMGAWEKLMSARARRGGADSPRSALVEQMLERRAQAVDPARESLIRDYVKIASTAFWDAYLKGDPKAKAYLNSDALVGYSGATLRIDRK